MTRNVAREITVQLLFGADLREISNKAFAEEFLTEENFESLAVECELYNEFPDEGSLNYINEIASKVDEHKEDIDSSISKFSHGWTLNRISGTALAVLRCAVCENLYMDDVPNGAAINSAVEIAKGYDEPETVKFINGVLGSLVRSITDDSK